MSILQPVRDGSHDFDFLIGKWRGLNRRLKERLVCCTEWQAFEAVNTVRHILGGTAVYDDVVFHRDNGPVNGITIRLYDAKNGEWSIYWAADGTGSLDIPMIGSFDALNGVGIFYAHEPHNGKHIYSRYRWSQITPITAFWDQALSADGGATWETNWITEFTRIE